MEANTGAPRHGLDGLNFGWNQLRNWRDKNLTNEKVAEIALLAMTTTVLGFVVWCAARAAENYTILGFG